MAKPALPSPFMLVNFFTTHHLPTQIRRFALSAVGLMGLVGLSATLGILGSATAQAQPLNYGNEWIVYGQPYFKLTVATTGVYRMGSSELTTAGVPILGSDPRKLQLYRLGKQVPMWVSGEADGSFDAGDYLLFYGEKNDGKLDSALYTYGGQPHTYQSLFSDTAAYFLTIGQQNGLRYTTNAGAAIPPTAEAFYMDENVYMYKSAYQYGRGYSDGAQLSDYTRGEGWLGPIISMGPVTSGGLTRGVLSRGYVPAGGNAEVEFQYFGLSNATALGGGPNHHMNARIGKGGTNPDSVLIDTLFRGVRDFRVKRSVPAAYVGTNTTRLIVRAVDDLGLLADNNTVSYIRFRYPRNFAFAGDSVRTLRFNSVGARSLKINLYGDTNNKRPILLDVANGVRVFTQTYLNATTGKPDSVRAFAPLGAVPAQLVLVDSSDLRRVLRIEPAPMTNYDPGNFAINYLIITNPKLKAAADDYRSYRGSIAGGSHIAQVYTVDELYNQFAYGQMTPWALRSFLRFMIDRPTVDPEYLLLLGKGYETPELRDSAAWADNLVPVWGAPPSDNILTAGLGGTQHDPYLATGRLTARTLTEAYTYLDKVKAHELQPPAIWQKRVLHTTGAKQADEKEYLSTVMNKYEVTIRKPFFGAQINRYDKNVSNIVTINATDLIRDNLNQGISLYHYFGHGSPTTLAVGLPRPQDLSNLNKYPLMLFNGCAVGNSFVDSSLAQGYLFTPNVGAIGWLANTGLGFPYQLDQFAGELYQNLAFDDYAKPYGVVVQRAIRDFQNNNDTLNLIQTQQTIFQGDPAVRSFGQGKPDYEVMTDGLFITPSSVSALSDSFQVGARIRNLGRATGDSIFVQVRRQLPDQTVRNYKAIRIPGPLFSDTVYFTIRSKDLTTKGLNRFTVIADTASEIDELNETNNQATLDFFMPGNGLTQLFPNPYAIVGQAKPALTVQADDLFTTGGEFRIEFDTSNLFNSPMGPLHRDTVIFAPGSVATWTPALFGAGAPQDSTVFYWRARLQNLPPNAGGGWSTSSFIFINNSPAGWSQAHFPQFYANSRDDLTLDTVGRKFGYGTLKSTISVSSKKFSTSLLGVQQDYSGFLNSGVCSGHELVIIHFDRFTLQPIRTVYRCAGLPVPDPENQRRYYAFPATAQGRIDASSYINDSIPAGNYVALFTRRQPKIIEWKTDFAFKAALASIGTDTNSVNALSNDSTSFVLLGRKGMTPAQALQNFKYHPSVNADSANLIEGSIFGFANSGRMLSTTIGPAKAWTALHFSARHSELPSADTASLSVIGYKPNGQLDTLAIGIKASPYPLSTISAAQYPYLKLFWQTSDIVLRTPPQLDRWQVVYTASPEGTVDPAEPTFPFTFRADTLQEGDTVRMAVAFRNISTLGMDSLLVRYRLTNARNEVVATVNQRLAPLPAADSLHLRIALPTRGLEGIHTLEAFANPNFDQPELYLFNNVLARKTLIIRDRVNPLLDVTVDGRHILDGDIVSPRPSIRIASRDENKFLLMNSIEDTASLEIFLRRPGMAQPVRVWMNNKFIQFEPASSSDNRITVNYRPGPLKDGTYELTVNTKDKSGNAAGAQPYSITFKVVNESTISRFYPYPNPCTDRMRFVFTLTGSDLPDQLLVSIMTVAGTVVREVNLSELGNMHIGTNITEWAWDGTDSYGDRLANGVYYYRVRVRKSGQDVKLMETAGDQFFAKGMGKLVLLR